MPIHTDQAVVLRLHDYSETSQIATLLTSRHGRVRLVAKGARRSTKKRFSVGLDLLERGEVAFAPPKGDTSLGQLTEWVQRNLYAVLRGDLLRLYAGLYAAEATVAVTEDYDPHPRLFSALVQLLEALARPIGDDDERDRATTTATDPVRVLARYQYTLVREAGFEPLLDRCADCGRPRVRNTPAWFSSTAGGLLCRDCEARHTEKRRIPAGLVDATRSAPAVKWFDLLDYHLTHIAGRPLRTPLRTILT